MGGRVKTLICCPIIANTHTASCNSPSRCLSTSEDVCVLVALNEYWRRAGIPRVPDYSASVQILKLLEDWEQISRKRYKSSQKDLGKR